ncbi:hypothetical protein B0H14DRAFT_3439266 [Mycena olivaceomarginata]|nr:hypothetical protein B0H14DRAFT_3439266 [Mycena olivaceomarginata]
MRLQLRHILPPTAVLLQHSPASDSLCFPPAGSLYSIVASPAPATTTSAVSAPVGKELAKRIVGAGEGKRKERMGFPTRWRATETVKTSPSDATPRTLTRTCPEHV